MIFSVLAKRLAGKSVSDVTCLVSSRTLNLNSVDQPTHSVDSITWVIHHEWECCKELAKCRVFDSVWRLITLTLVRS